jgi:hypothetical protein
MKGLELWNKLELTDVAYTKRFDKGSFKGTAVDAIYNIKRVSEQLGPVGFAWGWHIVKDELVKFEAPEAEPTWIHNCVVRAWFRQAGSDASGGSVREVEHVGSTVAARFVGRGPNRRFMVDDEYAKKSVTDALSKIMVSLGASADIWLGRFDGNKYVPPHNGEPAEEGDQASAASDLPAPRARTIEDNGLFPEARSHLLAVRGMDGAALREARNWLRLSPDGRQPSRWVQLGSLDRDLRDELAAAMNKRAAELGISLKDAA